MTKIPSYIRIRNMPGKWKTIKIDGDTVHVVDEQTGSRTVHRSRAIFLPETPKPKPPKPPEPPKWEQGELFGKSAFGIVHKYLEETPEGWIVRSKKGKALSKPASREQALKRLRQIEYYKRNK